MSGENIYGPGLSWRGVRRWALAGAGMWLPAYLRDSERQHIDEGENIAVGYARTPRTFRVANDVRKWPEEALPALIIGMPGLADAQPMRQPDRTFMAAWVVAVTAVCHGNSESDAELLASVYGLAVRKMFQQQAAAWADAAGYTGPPVTVETVTWEDEAYDEIDQARKRSVVAATATFTVVFRNVSSSMGGPDSPPADPSVDPGDWPEILQTELDIDREAL